MKCSVCNSDNLSFFSVPVQVPDMPRGVFSAQGKCLDCGISLEYPMNYGEALLVSKGYRANPEGLKTLAPYYLDMELLGLPKRINEGQGSCWQVRYAESKRWHNRVLGRMTLDRLLPPNKPLAKAQITLIRRSSRAPDYDGLVHSFKVVMDALKKCQIIKDDSMDVVGRPDYQWVKAPPKSGSIRVKVLDVAGLDCTNIVGG